MTEVQRLAKIMVLKDMRKEYELRAKYNGGVDYDCYRALDMAINALEQEPCTDAISREKALQIIRAWFDREATPSDLKNEIEQLPPVTPQYTDAEIQKMQDLEFAEIQKAYEIGKEEGSSEKPNKWIDAEVLDKIRAEIEEYRDTMPWESKSLVKWEAINYILEQIIDKYKASLTGAERSDKE